jgi:cell volume regulation protein A
LFVIDSIILIGAFLIIFAIASSKFAAKLGMPLVVLFIVVGMMAGSEGIGGIAFESYGLAHAIGTVSLAIILFDGGLGTRMSNFRLVWKPAGVLATFGVLITTVIVGLGAAWIMGIPLLEGMLIGAIAGSTDAAAVFSVFRGRGLNLEERLGGTIEVESGSNDPMAIFLTIGILQVLQGTSELGLDLVWLFVLQMGVGGVVGILAGKGAELLINRINLDAAGLYPVLTTATGLFAFGVAATLGGSGFLAIYIAGIVLGSSKKLVFRRGIYLFHDGMAWLSQITMFVVLGLLSFPSRLIDNASEGLAVAAVLVFVARPVAVFGLMFPFGFTWRELIFVSWAGLKGAVPVILATFPLLFGLPSGERYFDIIFFVVIVSALLQGLSLSWLAKWLGLLGPTKATPPLSLEITSLKEVDGDILGYDVPHDGHLAGRFIRDLSLPDGAVVALLIREQRIIPPRGSTRLLGGDHLFVVVRGELRPVLDRLFSGDGPLELPAHGIELQGGVRLGDLRELYGIELGSIGPDGGATGTNDKGKTATLDEFVRTRLADMTLEPGLRVQCGDHELRVTEVRETRVKRARLLKTAGQVEPRAGAGERPPPADEASA